MAAISDLSVRMRLREGIIDSAGYLSGVLSGNGMAWVAVELGWHAFFLQLAAVAALSSLVAIAVLRHQSEP